MDKTFARRYRLTKTDDYSSVFGFRRAIRGKLLMLHYYPNPNVGDTARIGLVVGKKQLKKAVDRNVFKRVMREQFRLQRGQLPVFDLVVRLMVKPAKLDRAELAAEFRQLVGKLRPPRPAAS